MYQVPPPREPNGCIQTIVITGIILRILVVPLGLIVGSLLAVLLSLYAFSVSPLLALGVIVLSAFVMAGIARWESHRISREFPPDD
jgi:hypothetical protein